MRSVAVCLSAVLALGSVMGCAVANQPDAEEVGHLQLPLISRMGSTVFRLSAQFVITNVTSGAVQTIDGSGDAAVLQVPLAPGLYTVMIADGFSLARSIDGGPFEPVIALLGSAQTVDAVIQANDTSLLSFLFLIGDEPPVSAVLRIIFGVVPQEGQLVGMMSFESASSLFEPYLRREPLRFVAPFGLAGQVTLSDPPTNAFFSSAINFGVASDPVGVVTSIARGLTGGTLTFQIETQPDDSQRFQLVYTSVAGAPFTQLTVETGDLQPRLPVNDVRIADDPVRSRLRATIPFRLVAGTSGENATGRIDLLFLP
jgi:hypothetical protein